MRIHRHLAELIIRAADLAEAEGRVLRRAVGRLGLGMSITIVAAALALVGCGLLLAAAWIGLSHELGHAWASAITGLITLALAGGLLALGVRMSR